MDQVREWLGLREAHGLGSSHVPPSANNTRPPVSRGYPQEIATIDDDSHHWTGRIITANTINPTEVRWLWRGRIPLGAITMVDGDPGLGKSLLSLDLAARVTTGRGMPDGMPGLRDGPAGVLLLSAEDDPATTIVPRLQLAAADLHRVGFYQANERSDVASGQTAETPVVLPRDCAILEQGVREHAARLVAAPASPRGRECFNGGYRLQWWLCPGDSHHWH